MSDPNLLVDRLEKYLRENGVISHDNRQYTRQRVEISMFYTGLLIFSTMAFVLAFKDTACRALCSEPWIIRRAGFSIFFGLFGLTARSWSFLNQGQSPFPPFVLTYPVIVGFACIAFSAAPLRGAPYYLLSPLVCFCLGYMPMDIYESVKEALRKRIAGKD